MYPYLAAFLWLLCVGGYAQTSAEAVTDASMQAAPVAPGNQVDATADGRGGATTYTMNMPLDLEGLKTLRQPYLGEPEFRGAYVTRFAWVKKANGHLSIPQTKQTIIRFMADAKDIGLNAVVFQVRSDATTLYPSTLEPWSQLVGGVDPGFDSVQFAIDEAHKNGLQFHAYINLGPCTEEKGGAPANPKHIFYQHCTPEASPNWLVCSGGKPVASTEYQYFNLNMPEVHTYLRNVVVDFARRYKVEGIHYDRIRFPSESTSDDAGSKQRFEKMRSGNMDYKQWQQRNITRMLTDIYASLMEINPAINVSASVWGIYDKTRLPQGDRKHGYGWTSSGLQNYHQDSVAWANAGCVDALMPMAYWEMGGNKPDYDEVMVQFMHLINNKRHVYGALKIFNQTEMLRETVATNLMGAQGTVPFTLDLLKGAGLGEFYKTVVYPVPAAVPRMEWKDRPKNGNVLITVKDPTGKPVMEATVQLKSQKRKTWSSADGFCAVLNVGPGNVNVLAEKEGTGQAIAKVAVTAGGNSRVEMTLTASPAIKDGLSTNSERSEVAADAQREETPD